MCTDVSFVDLIDAEEEFLNVCCMPSYGYRSEDILANDCCPKHCVYFVRRVDVMFVRRSYLKFFRALDNVGKREARSMFVNHLKKVSNEGNVHFSPITENVSACETLIARILGMSVHCLMNGICEITENRFKARGWYRKTVDNLSETITILTKLIQFNSLNRIMLPPNFSSRLPSGNSLPVPVEFLRKRMNVNLQIRKTDSLTRCSACINLPDIIKAATTADDKREAEQMHRQHLQSVSQQRVLVNSLCRLSRSDDSDTLVVLMDTMANKHSRLPHLVSRPKSITDVDLVPISLTTVQIAEQNGTNKFAHYEYPILSGAYSSDSSLYLSLLLSALSKTTVVPSTITLIMDSCRSNKSYVMLGGMGFLLTKIPAIQKVFLLYPHVGHTHLSVDGHFGTITKTTSCKDFKDPSEYEAVLRGMNSVKDVELTPTIYDFSGIEVFLEKHANVCSSGIISIGKTTNGIVHYSTGLTMETTELLFGAESTEKSIKMFKADFYDSAYAPSIRIPTFKDISEKVANLMAKAGGVLKDTNQQEFFKIRDAFGKKSIKETLAYIRAKCAPAVVDNESEGMVGGHVTVLQYLKSRGFNCGRIPKDPSINDSDTMDTGDN